MLFLRPVLLFEGGGRKKCRQAVIVPDLSHNLSSQGDTALHFV